MRRKKVNDVHLLNLDILAIALGLRGDVLLEKLVADEVARLESDKDIKVTIETLRRLRGVQN